MKKRSFTLLLTALLLLVCMAVFTSCALEHTHSFGEWTTVKAATCVEAGEQERLCSCGEKQTQAIPATGHSYGEWQITKNPTCTEAGEQERLCSCGDRQTQVVSATGHAYSGWQISKNPTCTEAGEQERICSCGDKQTQAVSPKGHSYSSWTTVKAATCTTSGLKERTCSCGDKQTETINATGHTFGGWKDVIAATCTKAGSQARTCQCGYSETRTVDATGHIWANATCTEPKRCTKCGITDGAALGHTVTSGKCSRCGQKVQPTVKLPATPLEVWDNDYSKMKINSIRYEYESYGDLHIYMDVEKTYQRSNSSYTWISFAYKLYDENGYVIDSGFCSVSSQMSVGEKAKYDFRIHSSKLSSTAKSYTLVIIDRD